MKDMNTFFFIGRQTKDIDNNAFGYLNNGTARLNLSIACNGIKKGEGGNWVDDVSFFDVTVWGRQAETLKDYISKGKQLAVTGHMQQQRWQDQSGQNHSKIALIAEDVQLLRDAGQRNGDGYQQPQGQQYTQQQQQTQQEYAQAPSQYAQQYQQQQPAQVAAVENAFKGQVVQPQQPQGQQYPDIVF